MGLRFFGLTPDYKKQVYQEVHDLVYYGNGGFIYSEVYQMPIHLRRYHIRKIDVLHKKQNEAIKKAQEGNTTTPSIPKAPNINKSRPF